MAGSQLRRILTVLAALIGIVVISVTTLKQCNSANKANIDVPSQPGSDETSDYANNGESLGVDVVDRSGPGSVDPSYTEPAAVTEWEHHGLIVMGENIWPVKEAISTAFITAYLLEDGYIPVNPIGFVNPDGPCQKKWYASDRVGGADVISESVMDAAAVAKNLRQPTDVVPGCPRDLGSGWESGSYVFDANGNDIAGFDFKNDPHAYEVVSLNGLSYVVFPEGGKSSKDDPALTKMKAASILIQSKRGASVNDRKKTASELQALVQARGVVSEIEYLPLRADHGSDEEFDEDYVRAIQSEIDALIKNRSKDPENRGSDRHVHILITARYSTANVTEQKRRIEAKIKKAIEDTMAQINVKIILLPLANEIPLCNPADSVCLQGNNDVMRAVDALIVINEISRR